MPKLIEGQPNEYGVICRNAVVLAFHLWPTIFAGAPFRLRNICRNGVPARSRTTTPLASTCRWRRRASHRAGSRWCRPVWRERWWETRASWAIPPTRRLHSAVDKSRWRSPRSTAVSPPTDRHTHTTWHDAARTGKVCHNNNNNNNNGSCQLPLSHWFQSMRRVAFSFLNSVASLLFSRATTEKSAFYFSDSPFWFSGTMPSYCMTVLWRRRRSKVHSIKVHWFFSIFSYCIA